MFDLPSRLLRKLRPTNRNMPSARVWDEEYEGGKWQYLRAEDELPRYALLAGYLHQRCPGGTILDLGCGEGVLCERLWPGSYGRYLGVDISDKAITLAKALALPLADFISADVEKFEVTERFDAIVFNEILYYFEDPFEVVARFAAMLNPDGVVLASMYLPSMRTIQKEVAEIERKTSWHHTYIVHHEESRKTWAIKVWNFKQSSPSD